MPVTFDPATVAIAGVNLLFLIIGLIEFIKGFFPDAPGKAWLALAFLLGVIGAAVAMIQSSGLPTSLEAWSAIVVLGLVMGLAAAKTFDESIGKRPYRRKPKLAPIYQNMTPNMTPMSPLVQGADGALYDTSHPRQPPYEYGGLAAASATLTKTTTIPLDPDQDEYDLSGLLDDDGDAGEPGKG